MKKKQSKKNKFTQKEKRRQKELERQAKHIAEHEPHKEIEVVLPKNRRELIEKIEDMLKKEDWENSVKLYRGYYKCTLREAREGVENIQEEISEKRKIFLGEDSLEEDEDFSPDKFFSRLEKIQEDMIILEAITKYSNRKIIQELKRLGVDFDKEEFLEEVKQFRSSEDLAKHWEVKYDLTLKEEEDLFWKSIDVLWGRLAPEVFREEELISLIEDGYDLLEEEELEKVCLMWLKAWDLISNNFERVLDIEEIKWRGISSLVDWCQDLEMELGEAGEKDSSFYDKRIAYCQNFCSVFPKSSRALLEEMKIAEVESYCALKGKEKGEEIFKSLIEKNPNCSLNYLAWASIYTISSSEGFSVDYDKVEKIYEMALERKTLDDRKLILLRLKALQEERNRPPHPFLPEWTFEKNIPTCELLSDLESDNPYELEEAIDDFIFRLESGYFLNWEALVCKEQGFPLTKDQAEALDDLFAFRDEEEDEDERILYIDEMPRPKEPWYEMARKIAPYLLLEQLRTDEYLDVIYTEGWLRLVEMIEYYGQALSLPQDVSTPINIIPQALQHQLWLQVCFDQALGDIGEEDINLTNQPSRIDSLIEDLREHRKSVEYLNLTLNSLHKRVTLPKEDKEILTKAMMNKLGVTSLDDLLSSFL